MTFILSQLNGDTEFLQQKLLRQKTRLNPSSTKSQPGWYIPYYRQLSIRQLSQLKTMYRDDFNIFGYNPNIEFNLNAHEEPTAINFL